MFFKTSKCGLLNINAIQFTTPIKFGEMYEQTDKLNSSAFYIVKEICSSEKEFSKYGGNKFCSNAYSRGYCWKWDKTKSKFRDDDIVAYKIAFNVPCGGINNDYAKVYLSKEEYHLLEKFIEENCTVNYGKK